MYEIAKIKIANITYTYSGDKSQKFAPAEKTIYTVFIFNQYLFLKSSGHRRFV
jgi:hypothetical protein